MVQIDLLIVIQLGIDKMKDPVNSSSTIDIPS